MLSGSDVVLDWAITHQSDPFPCPYSTGPRWIRRPREVLAKDPSSTPPRAAVDIEDADTVDGEVATERIVPVPKLGLQPELALGPSSRLKEVDPVRHCRPESVPGPPEPLAELPPPVRLVFCNPPGTMAPLWHALISVHGVPARVHPRQRRIGPEVVLKT